MDNKNPIENIDNKIFCLNCGKIGHLSKKCLCPIISVGIICIKLNIINIDLNMIIGYSKKIQNNYLFSIDEINKLKKIKKSIDNINLDDYDNFVEYLLIRRRNSLNYVEFIRGKYDINNLDYIEKTINFITNPEKEMIKNNNFDTLWVDLWGNNNNNSEYKESMEKFNLLKSGYYIKKNDINLFIKLEDLINNSIYNFTEPEWGFPKGRRNIKEKNIDCAKREFQEETTIINNDINIVNIIPVEEVFIASNNLKYKHIYYVGEIRNKNIELKVDNDNINQKMEIGDIKWFKFNDSLKIIREYNIEKKNILYNLHINIKYLIKNFKKILDNYLFNEL
jgi:8-oxo-dGTP pyrophosphatase MutT (NUDIX family)